MNALMMMDRSYLIYLLSMMVNYLWDKSSPDAIKEVFNMSKGSFKRAIGHIYKKKIINIETGKITLTKKGGAV